jgi:hypothetical protein
MRAASGGLRVGSLHPGTSDKLTPWRVLESRCGPILASRCGSIFASAEARLQVDSGRRRNGYEDEVLECLKASLPDGVRATIIADRGFGDKRRYEHLTGLGFDFIVRFRQDILLTEQFGDQRPASQWLHETGRARLLKDMAVTADYVLPTVVVHDKRMKEPWCLATNRSDLRAAEIVQLYGKRFTIEETFRDTQDINFGMG